MRRKVLSITRTLFLLSLISLLFLTYQGHWGGLSTDIFGWTCAISTLILLIHGVTGMLDD